MKTTQSNKNTIPNDWQEVKLGEVFGFIKSYASLSQIYKLDYVFISLIMLLLIFNGDLHSSKLINKIFPNENSISKDKNFMPNK